MLEPLLGGKLKGLRDRTLCLGECTSEAVLPGDVRVE